MKTSRLLTIMACACIVAQALTGIVSMGSDYEEANVAKIERGVTAEADLIAWFGKPSNRTTMSDGTVTLFWSHYSARGFVVTQTTGKTLSVTLGADGRVTSFSSSGGSM